MENNILEFERMKCNDGDKHLHVWSSPEGGQKIDIGKKIFCNRSLNMKSILAVGFDMDYTLAQYKPETFESLAYEGTVRKLVNDLGYPKEVYSLDQSYLIFSVYWLVMYLFNRLLTKQLIPFISYSLVR